MPAGVPACTGTVPSNQLQHPNSGLGGICYSVTALETLFPLPDPPTLPSLYAHAQVMTLLQWRRAQRAPAISTLEGSRGAEVGIRRI